MSKSRKTVDFNMPTSTFDIIHKIWSVSANEILLKKESKDLYHQQYSTSNFNNPRTSTTETQKTCNRLKHISETWEQNNDMSRFFVVFLSTEDTKKLYETSIQSFNRLKITFGYRKDSTSLTLLSVMEHSKEDNWEKITETEVNTVYNPNATTNSSQALKLLADDFQSKNPYANKKERCYEDPVGDHIKFLIYPNALSQLLKPKKINEYTECLLWGISNDDEERKEWSGGRLNVIWPCSCKTECK